MKIIRVFPHRTSLTPDDELAFVGEPPMFRPEADEVHVSCTFTWDITKAKRLAEAWQQYYMTVKLSGPAFDAPEGKFVPGRYIKQGVTFTSRGCNNQCPWCLVPKREGRLSQIGEFSPGNIIHDNNFLQCDKDHRAKVYEMLKSQSHIAFQGGLESKLFTDWDAENMRSLKIYQLFFACDTKGDIKNILKVKELLKDFSRDKLRCYVILAFGNQTLDQATEHLENVWQAGFMPHAQLFQPPDKFITYSKVWRDLARKWSRPAIMKTIHKAVTQ